jgi:hypothetical protein
MADGITTASGHAIRFVEPDSAALATTGGDRLARGWVSYMRVATVIPEAAVSAARAHTFVKGLCQGLPASAVRH